MWPAGCPRHPLTHPPWRTAGTAHIRSCPRDSEGVGGLSQDAPVCFPAVVRIQPHPFPAPRPPAAAQRACTSLVSLTYLSSRFLFSAVSAPGLTAPSAPHQFFTGYRCCDKLPLAQPCLSAVFTVSLNEQVPSLDVWS